MATRYTADFLLFLRDSPLCVRPDNLPPAEEWMGPPPEQQPRVQHQQSRSQGTAFGSFDKARHGDGALLDTSARRSELNRHTSKNSASGPDELVFGPPRAGFSSSGRQKGLDSDRPARDGDALGRFGNLRGEGDRFRETRNANPMRRRGDAPDQDGEGWSTVKPRKSFGTEGAERFHGRMGGNFRDDKRTPKDRDDRDRSGRSLEPFFKDKDGDEEGRPRNNGLSRGKTDSWQKTEPGETRVPEKRERIDRAKSWREREPDTGALEDSAPGRTQENRRWGGREQRVERDPEWLDDPADRKPEPRTQQDFQKWMEEMKKNRDGAAAPTSDAPADDPAIEAAKPHVRSPPTVPAGPDKFFMAFGSKSPAVDGPATPSDLGETTKSKPAGKSSRFTSFFQSQDGVKSDPAPPPMQAPTPAAAPPSQGASGMGLLGALQAASPNQPDEEKQAFQQLLMKLQKQSVSATPPGPSPFPAPGPPNNMPDHGLGHGRPMGPSPFQQLLGGERHNGPMAGGPPPQHAQEILAPRPQQQSARPEQLLQDMAGQQHQRVSSQSSARGENNPSRNNSNTEFLMNLMRAAPDSQRSDSAMMRAAHQHAQNQGPMGPPPPTGREGEFAQDSRSSQRQQIRPPVPPGFPMDDGFRGGEAEFIRHNQPTQILQRPTGPPGLDQMPPGWMGPGGPPGGQMPPPPQQAQQMPQQGPLRGPGPMMAPPGLPGGPGRGGPLPPHMFPPNMPPMPPHPDAMGSMPPRNMAPPPPGFFNGPPPPHGFIPGFNGPPPPDMGFDRPHFEGRCMPPPSGARGANFGRGQ